MQTNNHQIVDYDLILDQEFGKEGTPERIKAEEDALSFYSGQILLDARKEAKITQTDLAKREILDGFKEALKELKLHKEGYLDFKTLEDFRHELREEGYYD